MKTFIVIIGQCYKTDIEQYGKHYRNAKSRFQIKLLYLGDTYCYHFEYSGSDNNRFFTLQLYMQAYFALRLIALRFFGLFFYVNYAIKTALCIMKFKMVANAFDRPLSENKSKLRNHLLFCRMIFWISRPTLSHNCSHTVHISYSCHNQKAVTVLQSLPLTCHI